VAKRIPVVIAGGGLLADSRADLNIGRISEAWWPRACQQEVEKIDD
jgi:hypothetical protein